VRLVLDTNIALSGLLWGGPPGRLIDAALDDHIRLVSSVPLISELQGVLGRQKFESQLLNRGLTIRELLDGYAALVEVVRPAAIPPTVTRDPDDDQVLATALSGKADLNVSGDSDLLHPRSFRGIRIVTAAALLVSGYPPWLLAQCQPRGAIR
jgi:uncharacterized protein